jgi:transcriptional regulator with XRE-family HTH domain
VDWRLFGVVTAVSETGSGEADTGPDDAKETFATALRRLFDAVRRPDGMPYLPREVADEMTRRGHRISRSYLYTLLKGESEPSHGLVQALADFFEVPLEYFSNSERGRELHRQYEILAALGEKNIQRIAYRASQLSPEQLRNVLDYIDFQASRTGEDGSSGQA